MSLETGVDNETGVGVTCGGTPRGAEVGIPPAGGLTKVCVDMGKLGRGIVVGKEMFVGIGKLGKLGKFGNVVPVVSEKLKKNQWQKSQEKSHIKASVKHAFSNIYIPSIEHIIWEKSLITT